jgi:hypothetical protein
MDADKMFEELGYTIKENVKLNLNRLVYKDIENDTKISFCEEYKVVLKTQGIFPNAISMQELKAINKKCEELGWI